MENETHLNQHGVLKKFTVFNFSILHYKIVN